MTTSIIIGTNLKQVVKSVRNNPRVDFIDAKYIGKNNLGQRTYRIAWQPKK